MMTSVPHLLLLAVVFLGSTIQSGESFATTTRKATVANRNSALGATASFDDLRKCFPENADIVGAGGWNNVETLSKQDPKAALVGFVVDGLKGASAAVQPKSNYANSINEKIEALSLLLYGMGKGFSADAIDGEWDLVFTKQGTKSPSFQKLVGTRETAGSSKNIFDIKAMVFHGDVRFWRWGKVSSSVKVRDTVQILRYNAVPYAMQSTNTKSSLPIKGSPDPSPNRATAWIR
jgi:hypothetical protein